MPASPTIPRRTPAVSPEVFDRLRAAGREEIADAAMAAVQALRKLLDADDSRTIIAAASLIMRLQMAGMRHGWPPELGGRVKRESTHEHCHADPADHPEPSR